MAFRSSLVYVDSKNFNEVYPKFQVRLNECHFVAFDTEFSGLQDSFVDQQSLFDSPDIRYAKMRQGRFKILQFGLALFKLHAARNEWIVHCYSFLVFPPAFEAPKITETFTCQASCLLFLRMHNFDFNKWISEGIPYLNAKKAAKLKSFLKTQRSIMQTGSDIEKKNLSFSKTAKKKGETKNNLTDSEIEQVVRELQGFSRVIEDLSKSGKVLVGHNVYTDLLLTYQEFRNDLPETYEEFKVHIHASFPTVFDTKRLSFNVRDVLYGLDETEAYFDHQKLSDSTLETIFYNSKMKEDTAPKVNFPEEYKAVLDKPNPDSSSLCHQAAFDALLTGSLFIQLTYLLQRPTLQLRTLHCTFDEVVEVCGQWRNHINATRCTVPYLNLGGKDPDSHRPENIMITGHRKRLNLISTIDWLNKNLPKFGDYDLVLREGRIIIACGNKGCYRGVRRYLAEEGFIILENSGGFLTQWIRNNTKSLMVGGACILLGTLSFWGLKKTHAFTVNMLLTGQ